MINHKNIEEEYCKIEQYFCHECDCEWDWTFQRSFLGLGVKIRGPRWVRLD